jgi:hypothetical protein
MSFCDYIHLVTLYEDDIVYIIPVGKRKRKNYKLVSPAHPQRRVKQTRMESYIYIKFASHTGQEISLCCREKYPDHMSGPRQQFQWLLSYRLGGTHNGQQLNVETT